MVARAPVLLVLARSLGVWLVLSASVAAAECPLRIHRTHRAVTVTTCRDETVELCTSAQPTLRSCRYQLAVWDAVLSTDGNSLLVWYSSEVEKGARWVDVFDVTSRQRVAHFHPGVGGGFRWSGSDILLTAGCGTDCAHVLLFSRTGTRLLDELGTSLSFAPDLSAFVLSQQNELSWEPGTSRRLSVCYLPLDTLRGRRLSFLVPKRADRATTDPEVTWSEPLRLDLTWEKEGVEHHTFFHFPRTDDANAPRCLPGVERPAG
ncbi:hypothetical protein JGU66_03360 [Myxococcaceae bacterium JPH2]|nr:hypothetical protein [Myxococcaceae bacterium JPH2]